jgi:plastocyanin
MRARAIAAPGAAAFVALALAATAGPATGQAARPRIDVIGGNVYKVNMWAKSTLRFKPRRRTVESGAEVRIVNRTVEPHSFSLVKKADLPETKKEIESCAEGICGRLAAAHEFPSDDGPAARPVVDAGRTGFDRPGDSVVFEPKGEGDPVTIEVTAAKGRTLYFMCGFHPWMQGSLKVG